MTIHDAMMEIARTIAAQPRVTHLPVRNLALVEAYVEKHGVLPPGVELFDPDDPSVVTAYVGPATVDIWGSR